MSSLLVLDGGRLATVQDGGRPGLAHLGVGPSGAADRASLGQVNRLLGNAEDAAAVEATLGGLVVRAQGAADVAIGGAPAEAVVRPASGATWTAGPGTPVQLRDGDELALGLPVRGLRSYLGVRGGIAVQPVLGSRSRDELAGIGPAPLTAGDRLPVGTSTGAWPGVDTVPWLTDPLPRRPLRAVLGPRGDWFTPDTAKVLTDGTWRVSGDANRTAVVLDGPTLTRSRDGELPPEGMVRGAIQVPPSGRPTILLADHPVTGGYPVVAVLLDRDVDRLAQLRPGDPLALHLLAPAPL
ncbi:biotin-dependent carboxyltransferase family protein [Angustibacter sp. McL0619]|uniref:5-oxoprolinase subunit C family protein n=1 Tax=Angustibacter sp. McL0619 TaxID=3415676 RepID=UPI003CE7D7F2